MSRVLVLVLLIVSSIGVFIPTPTTAQDGNSPCIVSEEDLTATISSEDRRGKPLDARLGGQIGSWESQYAEGEPTPLGTIAYTFEGCGPWSTVQFVWERAVSISLYADRPEDIEQGTLSEPHEADWTQDEALAIARNLLPKDAELSDPEAGGNSTIRIPGMSEALGTFTAQERYDEVDANGDAGSLEVIFSLDEADEVFAIDVQLGEYNDGERRGLPKFGSDAWPGAVGDTVEADGMAVTLQNAYYTSEYGFSAPKGGYIFLLLEVHIENIDDDNHGYDGSRFAAQDLDGGAEFDDVFTAIDQPLDSGDLSPGEYTFGVVGLEVQETATNVRVKYDVSAFGGDDVYWLVPR